jgi:predicted anti-sigma-YlaC factor YlaD
MRCSKIQRKLSRFIDNEMTDLQKKEIENHLNICEEYQRVYQSLLQSWELLNVLPNPEPAPFLYTRIRARLSEQAGVKSHRWMGRILVPLSATAAVILGIIMGSIVGANRHVTDQVSVAENSITGSIDLGVFDDMPESSLGQIYYEFTGLQEQEDTGS